MTVRLPLADFRAVHQPAAATKATASFAEPAVPTAPSTPNFNPYLVVQNVCATIASGTGNIAPVAVNLIDGVSGGTNVQWSGVMSAGTGQSANITADSLSIPCYSGTATIEFGSAPGAGSFQAVSMSGYFITYGGN